jgi:3-hydroxyisobutyrate dehydrogenase
MNVGIIGLGNIGSALAANLLRAGLSLTVHDLRREAADSLVAAGATWADSARATAEGADFIITSLPSPPVVSAVMEGPDGVLAHLP